MRKQFHAKGFEWKSTKLKKKNYEMFCLPKVVLWQFIQTEPSLLLLLLLCTSPLLLLLCTLSPPPPLYPLCSSSSVPSLLLLLLRRNTTDFGNCNSKIGLQRMLGWTRPSPEELHRLIKAKGSLAETSWKNKLPPVYWVMVVLNYDPAINLCKNIIVVWKFGPV